MDFVDSGTWRVARRRGHQHALFAVDFHTPNKKSAVGQDVFSAYRDSLLSNV